MHSVRLPRLQPAVHGSHAASLVPRSRVGKGGTHAAAGQEYFNTEGKEGCTAQVDTPTSHCTKLMLNAIPASLLQSAAAVAEYMTVLTTMTI